MSRAHSVPICAGRSQVGRVPEVSDSGGPSPLSRRLVAGVWSREAVKKLAQGNGQHTIKENGQWALVSPFAPSLPGGSRPGNVQAARGGPTSYGKRVVRRKVYRITERINRRVPNDLGL